MNLILRLEQAQDYRLVEELTREAFWGMNHPDCDEHLLVHRLRNCSAFIPELDYVAEENGKIVGNIMYSKARIVDKNKQNHSVITFGPLSVLPEYQSKGVGRLLMEHSIAKAKELGYNAIVFYGHPDYYPRFGFTAAKEYGISTSWGKYIDAHMAMPLHEDGLKGISGQHYDDPVFTITAEDKEEFDRGFPPKEKVTLTTADDLYGQLSYEAQKALKKHKIKLLCNFHNFSEREVREWKGIDDNAVTIIKTAVRGDGRRWGKT